MSKPPITKPPLYIKHFCNPGDLIAAMAALKAACIKNERKVILCQQLNVKAGYYTGAVHGTVDEEGTMVTMNKEMYDLIRPLILSQDYIEDMQVFDGQEALIDLDVIRQKHFVNLPHGSIQSWVFYAFPFLSYDISKPWIELPDKDIPIVPWMKGKILLNFTERYRNGHIHYYFLRKFKDRLVFAGTEREYRLFTNAWKIDMPRLEIKDFLELAYAIKSCKFLLANQSMCWNIAEAMKTPRILEVCRSAVNCLPFYGEKSYGFYDQDALEYFVDLMTD